jgi:hypothetical protein
MKLLTTTPEGAATREAIQSTVAPIARRNDGSLHPSIIGFAADGEQSPEHARTVHQVNRWLHEDFDEEPDPKHANSLRRVSLWLEGLYEESVHQQILNPDSLGRLTMVAPRFLALQDFREDWRRKRLHGADAPWGGHRGAITEHNGGRFGLPELKLNRDSIEYFERHVQVRHLRQYTPSAPSSFVFGSVITKDAILARNLKKRLVVIPFVSSNIWVNQTPNLEPQNGTVGFDRILEPAEIRGAVNIAIANGAKGIFWQVLTHGTDVMSPKLDSTLDTLYWHGNITDYPISGKFVADAARDLVDTMRFYSRVPENAGDAFAIQRFGIPNFWAGWGVRSRAVKQINHWLDTIGTELMRLDWRDVYSIHAAYPIVYLTEYQDQCGVHLDSIVTVKDTVPARPLPSTEIITDVITRNPVTGVVDHDSATYVELGFFEKKPGRRFDDDLQTWVTDQMRDSHHVMVVNRRVFEPTDDIVAGARRDSMVALAGTRQIGLKLNLMKFGEYTFCRITEVAPDRSPLPGDTALRTALDTIVPSDSLVFITLGPGRASLLRITYIEWNANIFNGRLEYANQRKIAWDPSQRRFHATYMKPHDTSRYDAICYRRSHPVTDTTGSILWEGLEYQLSYLGGPTDSIQFNRHSSLTIRRPPLGAVGESGTLVTVVWTGHRKSVMYAQRQVHLRNVWSPDAIGMVQVDNMVEVVDSAVAGQPENRWGTPVISRADGADIIAWSDSADGIMAVARIVSNPGLSPLWFKSPWAYTDTVSVSGGWGTAALDTRGRYPAVPTFANIRSVDSNIAIVWEQPIANAFDGTRRSDIYYRRLRHAMSGAIDTLIVVNGADAVVSTMPGDHRNPTISQNQDTWREVQDVVVWETEAYPFAGAKASYINARSIFTETRTFNGTDQPDQFVVKPQLWGWAFSRWSRRNLDWLYPNVSSITYRDSSDVRKALSSIAFRYRADDELTPVVKEMSYQWAAEQMHPSREYSFPGRFAANSETPTQQSTRHALLYEVEEDDSTVELRTSREFFFAKGRPTGYIADGRMSVLRLSDTSAQGFSILMADTWTANDTASMPVRMIARDTSLRIIAAFGDATALLRTRNFGAGDSTVIGVTVSAMFHGDTTGYSGTNVTYVVELVDSATGTRVHRLDSFRLSTTYRAHHHHLVDTLDLVSGKYYLRTNIDTVGVVIPSITNDSRYPVGEFQMMMVDSTPMFKVRRIVGASRHNLRVTSQPNPASSSCETRFTVPSPSRVRIIVSEYDGQSAVTLLDEWMEAGRYAIDIDTRDFRPGIYLVQVHAGNETGLTKLVVSP